MWLQSIYGHDFHEIRTRLRAQATYYFFNQIINKPDFPSLADEIVKSRPDMNIKVATFTVTKKFYNIRKASTFESFK